MPLTRSTLTFDPEGPASATCVLLALTTLTFDPEGLVSGACVLLVRATLVFGSSTSASSAAPFRFRPRFLLIVASSTCSGVLAACLAAFLAIVLAFLAFVLAFLASFALSSARAIWRSLNVITLALLSIFNLVDRRALPLLFIPFKNLF